MPKFLCQYQITIVVQKLTSALFVFFLQESIYFYMLVISKLLSIF